MRLQIRARQHGSQRAVSGQTPRGAHKAGMRARTAGNHGPGTSPGQRVSARRDVAFSKPPFAHGASGKFSGSQRAPRAAWLSRSPAQHLQPPWLQGSTLLCGALAGFGETFAARPCTAQTSLWLISCHRPGAQRAPQSLAARSPPPPGRPACADLRIFISGGWPSRNFHVVGRSRKAAGAVIPSCRHTRRFSVAPRWRENWSLLKIGLKEKAPRLNWAEALQSLGVGCALGG